MLDAIDMLPDISFIDNMSLTDCQNFLIEKYQENYKNITGKNIVLQKASQRRIELLSVAHLMYQALQYIDNAGKMNFLKYAYGDYLDHIGAFKKVVRKEAKPATVKVEFALSEPRKEATGIPAGTMATADQKVFFITKEYAEIPAGTLSIIVEMICTTNGASGNNFAAGEISTLCNPVSFVASIKNIETSAGGEESQSDEDYRESIYIEPSGYSVAGPDDAWIAVVKKFSSRIEDVKVWSGSNSEVDICIMLKNGIIPDRNFIDKVLEYLNQPDIKPTADLIHVYAPIEVKYTIEAVYYIEESKKNTAESIQSQVRQAAYDYICWQGAHGEDITASNIVEVPKVGRDINPDKLTEKVRQAGAKRIVITNPIYTKVNQNEIASLNLDNEGNAAIKLIYGGIESD